MKELLQELWDEFSNIIDAIEDISYEYDIPLDHIVSDTIQMERLRDKLYNAGILNISGKVY